MLHVRRTKWTIAIAACFSVALFSAIVCGADKMEYTEVDSTLRWSGLSDQAQKLKAPLEASDGAWGKTE
ncbi:MAG: hypothetical protein HXX11_21930 [Desulfuromonadales bacterium]|nr:hypothetical protein [Desulfuromonadales bacterium]